MSDKEKSTIICHCCRWGAIPGNLTQCNAPNLPKDLNALRAEGVNLRAHEGAAAKDPEEVNPVKWALPSMAAATGICPYFDSRD